ncbi:MAG TPA: molybdopterin-dependent oxidoreductase, partial [Candidatus Saccharimonadales bacterium]|nr:molybdopterin-dependent oxidoreductase [Candidatus Saccharimonadales bacterium]
MTDPASESTVRYGPPVAPWPIAAAAGVLAAGVALAATELLAGLVAGAPSVIVEIGALVISLQPGGAKQIVVDLFGTADKLALNIAVAIGALVLAGALGVIARRHRGWGNLGFAAIAILGLGASLRDPLVDPILALVAAVVGVAIATQVLRRLLDAVTPSGLAEMPDWGRRRFIGTSLAVAAGAIVGGGIGRLLIDQRDAVATATADIPLAVDPVAPLQAGAKLAVAGISPLVTSNSTFYRIDTSLLTPRLDVTSWKLSVDGMVDHPFSINYAELLAMPMHEEYVTIACVSNEVGGNLVGNALWRGARLRDLLDRAGVQAGATQIVPESFDGWTAGFPTAWLDKADREALVAVAMNGVQLPNQHGYPARLIVPGLYGYVSATKWLTHIKLTTLEAQDAYWVPLGWAKEAPILTQSRIDVPQDGGTVSAGPAPIAGVAWAPDRGVSRVEVQVDNGAWTDATLSTPISPATWVQWLYRWQATSGDHLIRVRATDLTGEVQPATVTPPAPDGARG